MAPGSLPEGSVGRQTSRKPFQDYQEPCAGGSRTTGHRLSGVRKQKLPSMILRDVRQRALFYLYLQFSSWESARLLLCLPREWGTQHHHQGTAFISTEHTEGSTSLQTHQRWTEGVSRCLPLILGGQN